MPSKKTEKHVTHSPEETMEIGQRFASRLGPGAIVCLYGELGGGKTVFVKGVCAEFGVQDNVTSPSFVIATEYRGRIPIAHIDLYRLDASSAADLHLEDYIASEGITLIEWADRLDMQKGMYSEVIFVILGPTTREITIENPRH